MQAIFEAIFRIEIFPTNKAYGKKIMVNKDEFDHFMSPYYSLYEIIIGGNNFSFQILSFNLLGNFFSGIQLNLIPNDGHEEEIQRSLINDKTWNEC